MENSTVLLNFFSAGDHDSTHPRAHRPLAVLQLEEFVAALADIKIPSVFGFAPHKVVVVQIFCAEDVLCMNCIQFFIIVVIGNFPSSCAREVSWEAHFFTLCTEV